MRRRRPGSGRAARAGSSIGLVARADDGRHRDRRAWIAPFDPNEQDVLLKLEPPSAAHLFGTDAFGRDVLSRVIFGARISLFVGAFATLAGVVIGTVIGVVSGYFGGLVDRLITRRPTSC